MRNGVRSRFHRALFAQAGKPLILVVGLKVLLRGCCILGMTLRLCDKTVITFRLGGGSWRPWPVVARGPHGIHGEAAAFSPERERALTP